MKLGLFWRLVLPGSSRPSARGAGGAGGWLDRLYLIRRRSHRSRRTCTRAGGGPLALAAARAAGARRTARSMTRRFAARRVSTIDTLRDYQRRFPAAQLFYPIGGQRGQAAGMARAGGTGTVESEFVVIPRPGQPAATFPAAALRGRMLKGFPLGVSSLKIAVPGSGGGPSFPRAASGGGSNPRRRGYMKATRQLPRNFIRVLSAFIRG